VVNIVMAKTMYIVDGLRTPFCKMGTDFADEPAQLLGIASVKALLAKTGVSPEKIDETIFGCVGQPADAMNIARVIAVRSGIPTTTPAYTVHRNCASGLEAITQAYEKANAGKGDVFMVGGVENMSRYPLLYPHSMAKKLSQLARSKTIIQKIKSICNLRIQDFTPKIALKLGLSDVLCDMNMGETAELIARENGITREEQDMFALNSHRKVLLGYHKLAEEIASVYCTYDNCIRSFNNTVVTTDNGPRESTMSTLERLRPLFDRKEGTVTAGNSSQITDGACALLLMTKKGLKDTGCTPIGRIMDYSYTGCDPSRMGLGPVKAVEKLTSNSEFKLENMDLVEINEAFAAQVLACQKYLHVPEDKLNVNGGSIALGHPVGATGARLVLTLLKELNRQQLKSGLATLCIGGGQGGAIWLEAC
jgi:acetyl-CoA acetyltransferase family protein